MNDAQNEPPPSPSDEWRTIPLRELLRRGGKPLVALLALALGYKLVVLAAALSGNPLAHHATSDVAYYLDQARRLLSDHVAAEPFHMPPLYPRLLAWLGSARAASPAGGSLGATPILFVQIAAGVGGLLLVWIAAARRVGPRAGLVAPIVCLAYGPLSFFELKGLGDSLAANLLLALVVALETLPRTRRPALVALSAGVLGALAALLRPQALLLLALLAPWIWHHAKLRGAAAFLGAAALVLLPSTLHNLEHGAGFAPVSDNGAFNLWIAHTGPLSGSFATDRPEFGNLASQAHVSRALASEAAGSALSWADTSAHWRREALAAVMSAPAETLQRIGLRAAALVESFSTGIVTIPEVEIRLMAPLRLAALRFGLLLGAFLGLWVAAGRPRPSAETLPWLLLAATVLVSTLMFFHYERFRLPLVPALGLGVAVFGARLVRRRREERSGTLAASSPGALVVGGLLAAAVTAQSYLPRSHHANTLANGWTSVAEARWALADGAKASHETGVALDEFDRALAIDPRFPRALLGALRLDLDRLAASRGSPAVRRTSYDRAGERLRRAEAVLGVDWPELRVLRGRLHLESPLDSAWHDPQAALAIYEQLEAEARLSGSAPRDGGVLSAELRRRGLR